MEQPEYPLELTAPDISAYRQGTGDLEYFFTFDSGRAGPHVGITAIVHGNELCGAIALDHLLRHDIRPQQGRLTLGFCNVAAFARFDLQDPLASRFVDEDFNRVWDRDTLLGERESVELSRAREIRPAIEELDFLLDLHSMQTAVEPLALTGLRDKNRALARQLGVPRMLVADEGHQAGRRMRDHGWFDNPANPQASLLLECGQHWATSSADVAIDASYRFLNLLGAISRDSAEPFLSQSPPDRQTMVEVSGPVTVETDSFHFVDDYIGLEVIERKGSVIAYDGAMPVVTPFDNCVLIMPSRRLSIGQTAVRLGRIMEA